MKILTTLSTRKLRFLAIFCLLNFVFNTLVVPISYALTSGPSQPEISSFASIDTSNMVDLFSGDFSYNIPLVELPGPNGGYPFNLVYNSGVSPEQEASWVGLGWNVTPGSIQRQMRGIPDEFKGDEVVKTTDMKPDNTYGLTVSLKKELFGFDVPKQKQADSSKFSISIPITLYYNNYKGFGYSLSVNPNLNLPSNSSASFTSGLSFTLDSREGTSIVPSLGLQLGGKKASNVFNLSTGYHSRTGLMNIGLSAHKNSFRGKGSNGMSFNVNLYNQGHTPSSELPMRTANLSGSLSTGLPGGLFFGHAQLKGFFNSQWVKKEAQHIPAYGYMYSQDATEEAIMDINRSNEQPITKESPSLSIPEAMYDVYSVSGHGLQGSFRPYRSDIGIYGNPKVTSIVGGAELGLDFGSTVLETHVGTDIGVNMGATKSKKWTNGQNRVKTKYKHTSVGDNSQNLLHEPFYFKFTSDRSSVNIDELAYIGDSVHQAGTPILKPVRVKLGAKEQEDFDEDADGKFKIRLNTPSAMPELQAQNEKGTYKAVDITSPFHPTKTRESRNTLIQQFTNAEAVHIDLCKVAGVDRASRPAHHIGAFVVTKPDGARYIYALPAYNTEHIEGQLTVAGNDAQCGNIVDMGNHNISGTDKYFSETKISPYPYAHLLTAIVGDDYVDTDEIPGPSNGDIGYWVKFNYERHTDNYQWRTPFAGVNYAPGFINTKLDDKGSYLYGKKEIYYVTSAETKSHRVEFKTSVRQDGRGASSKTQNTPLLSATQKKLDEIALYVKGSSTPLKRVVLSYASSQEELCQNVLNRAGSGGKLTLKQVKFLYQHSTRGNYNAYTFHYDHNPAYNPMYVDRWGTYTSVFGSDGCRYQHFPYTDQRLDRDDAASSYPEYYLPTTVDRHKDASAWLLSAIDLPSGSTIKVAYEADDYAYVQNKVAMQMMPITGVGDTNATNRLDKNSFKVFFRLEKPIVVPNPSGDNTSFEQQEVAKYLDVTGQIYFKSKIQLQKPEKNFEAFVTGYADVNMQGARGLVTDGIDNTMYKYGYLTLKPIRYNGEDFHPFSVAAWQHIKGKQPKLLVPDAPTFGDADRNNFIRQISTLASIVPEIKRMFQGYYDYMYAHNWGREMDLSNSWIRLNTPDKIKYGGGVRVKRILLDDKWQSQEGRNSFYGQQYDYHMEEDGQLISSGVASYEPQIGGEENALRYGEAYEQKLLLAADNHYFLEHPINEGLYPGAQVGYRKVTVKSLAAANLSGEDTGDASSYFVNAGFHATTGVTVHEFYTAKEFPVIVDRTTINRVPYGFWLPLLIGQITVTGLTASQGFSVETNDMHGKPKQVTHYRQKPDGSLIDAPVSWTKYNYKKVDRGTVHKGGTPAFGVDNRVEVLLEDKGDDKIKKEHRLIGLERELVVDMQEQASWSGNVSVDLNAEIKGIFFVPGVAPFIGASFNATRTVTTNKIISRSGILESVEAYDGTATLKTKNLLWDVQTAEVLLTSVNNSFDSLIYNYSIPARFHYENTKAAYHNADIQVTTTNFTLTQNYSNVPHLYTLTSPSTALKHWVVGDELLIQLKDNESTHTWYATCIKKEAGVYELFVKDNQGLTNTTELDLLTCKVIRSGNRNLLGAKVGAITALVDPTDNNNRTSITCEKELIFPSDCEQDPSGLGALAITWNATNAISIAQNTVEVEVSPNGGTGTYTYTWKIYDQDDQLVQTLQSYTRRVPISNTIGLNGSYTITCSIEDTQGNIATTNPRIITFN